MNLLRSPMVVGILVLIACGVIGNAIFHPFDRPPAPPPVARALETPGSPPTSGPRALFPVTQHSATSVPLVEHGTQGSIDQDYVRKHFNDWIETPQHDPFALHVSNSVAPPPPSPVPQWRLKAVWRQTGSSLALINKGIYKEGDVLDGYTLERIEADQVWFAGPNTRERLGFEAHPRASTNAPTVKQAR